MADDTTESSSDENQPFLQLITQEFTHFYNSKYSKVHRFHRQIQPNYILTHQVQTLKGNIYTQSELPNDTLVRNAYLPIQEHQFQLCDDPCNPNFYINDVRPEYPDIAIEMPHPGIIIRPISPELVQGLTPSGFHITQRANEQARSYAQFENSLRIAYLLYCQILINAKRRVDVAQQQIMESIRLLKENNVQFFQKLMNQPDFLTLEAMDLDLQGNSLDDVYFSGRINEFERNNQIRQLPKISQISVRDIIDYDEIEFIEDFYPERFHGQFDGYRDTTDYGIVVLTNQGFKLNVRQVARRYTCYETLLILHKICKRENIDFQFKNKESKQQNKKLKDQDLNEHQQMLLKNHGKLVDTDYQSHDLQFKSVDSPRSSKLSLSIGKQVNVFSQDIQQETLLHSNENISELSATDLHGNRLKYLNLGWEDEKGECRVCNTSYKSLFQHIKTEKHINNYQLALDGPINPAEKYIQANPLTCRQFINGYGRHMSKRVQLEAMLQGICSDLSYNLNIPPNIAAEAITLASYKRGIPMKTVAGNYARSTSPTLKTNEMVQFLHENREKTAEKIEKSCEYMENDAIETYSEYFAQLLNFGHNYYNINRLKIYKTLLQEKDTKTQNIISKLQDNDCFYTQQMVCDYIQENGDTGVKSFIDRVIYIKQQQQQKQKIVRSRITNDNQMVEDIKIIVFKQETLDKSLKNFEINIIDDFIQHLSVFLQQCLKLCHNFKQNYQNNEEIQKIQRSTPKLPTFLQFQQKYYDFIKLFDNNQNNDDLQFILYLKQLIFLNEEYSCNTNGTIQTKKLIDFENFQDSTKEAYNSDEFEVEIRSQSCPHKKAVNQIIPRANSVSTWKIELEEDHISMQLLQEQFISEDLSNIHKKQMKTAKQHAPTRKIENYQQQIRERSRLDHLADALDIGLIVQSNKQFGISAMDASMLYLDALNVLHNGFTHINYRYIMHYVDV